ncbi:hypothetical protein DL771_008291 [Monosporascus sp. 5C6A]|nr:hypothetical protein DL771_008291 [Monosporascus sp. 5C6A]
MPWSSNIRKLVIGVVPGSDANVMFPEPSDVLQLVQSLPGLEQTFIAISFEAVPHTVYTPSAALDLPKDEFGFSRWAAFKEQCPDLVSRLETHINSTSYEEETVDEWLVSLANEALNRGAPTEECELLQVRVLLRDTSAAPQHVQSYEILQGAGHFVLGAGEGVLLPGGNGDLSRTDGQAFQKGHPSLHFLRPRRRRRLKDSRIGQVGNDLLTS